MKTNKIKQYVFPQFVTSLFIALNILLYCTPTIASNLGELIELKDQLNSIQTELGQLKSKMILNQKNQDTSIQENEPDSTESDVKNSQIPEIIQTHGNQGTIQTVVPKPTFISPESLQQTEIPTHRGTAMPSSVISSSRFTSNYLIITPSVTRSNAVDYKFPSASSGEIQTNTGFGLNIELGRKINNWELGLSLGFERTPFDNLSWEGNSLSADGESTSYQLMFNPGYRFQLADSISFKTGIGLGFANRHDHLSIDLLSPRTLYEENIVFLGQIDLSLAFRLSSSTSMLIGYRYGFLENSGLFDSISSHAFEIGPIWDL